MPGAWPGGMTFPDVGMYEDIARLCERGCFDMVFSGDGTGIPSTWKDSVETAVEWGMTFPRQDLNPLMVAMSRVTEHVGYGITYAARRYLEPLIQGEAPPPYLKSGLPHYVVLRNVGVPRQLPAREA